MLGVYYTCVEFGRENVGEVVNELLIDGVFGHFAVVHEFRACREEIGPGECAVLNVVKRQHVFDQPHMRRVSWDCDWACDCACRRVTSSQRTCHDMCMV